MWEGKSLFSKILNNVHRALHDVALNGMKEVIRQVGIEDLPGATLIEGGISRSYKSNYNLLSAVESYLTYLFILMVDFLFYY